MILYLKRRDRDNSYMLVKIQLLVHYPIVTPRSIVFTTHFIITRAHLGSTFQLVRYGLKFGVIWIWTFGKEGALC